MIGPFAPIYAWSLLFDPTLEWWLKCLVTLSYFAAILIVARVVWIANHKN